MQVSLIGLGTVKFGRNEGVRYPRPFDLPDDATLDRLLDRALELGINLIDTAPAYGTSEARLGRLLGRRRTRFLLCTKVGETFTAGVSRFDFSAAAIRASIGRSLERLATDYLDVVLLHSDGKDLEVLELPGTLEALADLKSSGVIRAFGMSHKTEAGGLAASAVCDVIMTTLNRDDRSQLGVIAAATAHGCAVLVKKPLNGGRGARNAQQRAAQLQFAAAQSGVSCIVVGTLSEDHLAANVAALAAVKDVSGPSR
jgi:aryl-alcohol dehydrogenase-like predicted oxidoreductase